MAITKEADLTRDLTIFTITGPFTVAEVGVALDDFYADTPTKHVMWDMREAVLPEAPTEEVRQSIRAARDRAQVRAGGKTALVMSDAADYAAGLVAEGLAEMEQMPITVQSFIIRSIAEQWLTEDVPTKSHGK